VCKEERYSTKFPLKMAQQLEDAGIAALAAEFEGIGSQLMRGSDLGNKRGSAGTADRRFRAWFGCSTTVCAMTWDLIVEMRAGDGGMGPGATKERFLLALMILKHFDIEENMAAAAGGVDEKTLRKWGWFFIEEISFLESIVVSLEERDKSLTCETHSCF
jgi:hypothetical protein